MIYKNMLWIERRRQLALRDLSTRLGTENALYPGNAVGGTIVNVNNSNEYMSNESTTGKLIISVPTQVIESSIPFPPPTIDNGFTELESNPLPMIVLPSTSNN